MKKQFLIDALSNFKFSLCEILGNIRYLYNNKIDTFIKTRNSILNNM